MSMFPITFPDKIEQKAIANYLDQAREKIDKTLSIKKQQIEKLNQAYNQVISDTFSSLSNSDKSNFKKLKVIVNTTKGYAFKSSLFIDAGYPIVKASDIKKDSIKQATTFMSKKNALRYLKVSLQKNDIVISTVGSQPRVPKSAVGQLAFIDKKNEGGLLNQNTVILRINSYFNLLPLFLFLQLKTLGFRL